MRFYDRKKDEEQGTPKTSPKPSTHSPVQEEAARSLGVPVFLRSSQQRAQREHRSGTQLQGIQKKSLEVSSPIDANERKADEAARKVVDEQSAEIHRTEGTVNSQPEDSSRTTPEFQSQLAAKAGSGQSLDDPTRAEMESKMGADFSGVKIHTGSEAYEMNVRVNAKAFTHGQDIYFKEGNSNHHSREGKELLAHELTHTLQQKPLNEVRLQIEDVPYETITVKKGQTLYRIALERGTTVAEIQKLNNLTTIEIKEGQSLKVPKKTPAAQTEKQPSGDVDAGKLPSNAKQTPSQSGEQEPEVKADQKQETPAAKNVTYRGDVKGDKRLLVAWSIDDGPRGKVTEKMKKEGMGGIPQATWFIQYHNIKTEDWENMRNIQSAGGEVAIHSFYEDDDHAAWFPKVKGPAYGSLHIEDSMATRMEMLKAFAKKLSDEKIFPKFVRLPGGLVSELENYTTQVGFKTADASAIANAIIGGKDVTSYGAEAEKIAADFAFLKKSLNELNLLLWGSGDLSVNTNPTAIGRQEWTAETSGASGRHDYTTDVVDPSSKTQSNTKLLGGHGSFEKLIATLKPGDVRGMVVLTHDTLTQKSGEKGQDDVRAVKEDREHMEKTCAEKAIVLEYHTMSSLFTEVTGKDISTYKAEY